MNVDQDRPYVCTAPGCTQRFQREDHLIIHRHKHEMTLKFPAINCDNTLSDQTPTPTRFLRNCEEVGLFSDLELDEGTEEEQENIKQNFIHQSVSSQPHNESQRQHHQFQPQPQRLPQPQCLPQPQQHQCSLTQLHDSHLNPQTSQSVSHCSMARHTSHNTSNAQSAPSCLRSNQRPSAACAMQGTSTMHMNTQLSMESKLIGIPGSACSGPGPHQQRSKVMLNQTHPTVSNGSQNPAMMEMMSSQQHRGAGLPLTHLPVPPHHSYQQRCHSQSQQRHIHQHQNQQQSPPSCAHHSPPSHLHPGPVHPTGTHMAHQPVPAQISPVPQNTSCSQSPPQASGGKRRRTSEEDPDERRRKFLERNRAAASRCRQKRKVWVVSLEKKAEELTHTNLQLQNEVSLLRSEVTQLKQILLAHKDCPVTARQRETQGGSPTGSPVQTRAVQNNSISTSSTPTALTHLTTHSHCAS